MRGEQGLAGRRGQEIDSVAYDRSREEEAQMHSARASPPSSRSSNISSNKAAEPISPLLDDIEGVTNT